MSISIDPTTFIITIPQSYLTLVGGSLYELDTNQFRLDLKAWEDDEEGITFTRTHTHNTEVTLGGLTYARVIEILSPYTITFEDGQYAVNLIGSNNNIADKTNVNQVSIRPGNSAGLITSKGIESLEFGQGVTIDVINGSSGQLYPKGTPRDPVDNLTDALAILTYRGYNKLFIKGSITFVNGDNLNEIVVIGESPKFTTITLNSGVSTESTIFKEAIIQGILDGDTVLECCIIEDLSYVDGQIKTCMLRGTIILDGTNTPVICDCIDGFANGFKPIIDMGGSGRNLVLTRYTGDILIKNLSGNQFVSIDLLSGDIYLTPSITNGTFELRGVGKLVQNFSTGTTIYTDSLINPEEVADAVWDEQIIDHIISGSFSEYIKANNEKNISYQFTLATSQIPVRNVDVGRVSHMTIRGKKDSDSDWSSPIYIGILYYWYANMGDPNPQYIKENT